MMGKPGHPDEKGLIPRSLEQIFQTKQSQQPQGWKYEMQVTLEYFLLFFYFIKQFNVNNFVNMT
jgi:hypothetical protein